MEKTQKTFTTIEEEFLAWKKQFKKDYSTIKPTLEDAFRGGCMAIAATLPKPSFSKEDIDEVVANVEKTIKECLAPAPAAQAKPKDLFRGETHNRTLDDIHAMHGELLVREAYLRQCIREAVSLYLTDTCENNPLSVDITLDTEGGPGLSCLESPRVTAIWQDPAEGIIWVVLDGSDMDFGESLRTEEQIQVLQYLQGVRPARDPGLTVYPMASFRGLTKEELSQLHPEEGCFDGHDPYFHYDLKSGLLESLTDMDIARYNDGLPEERQLVMATLEQAFDLRWKNTNVYESEETLRQYNEEIFDLYEKTGFADTFVTSYSDKAPRNGETFEVVRRAGEEDGMGPEALPMWLIRFDDDTTAVAYPEEITLLERNKRRI